MDFTGLFSFWVSFIVAIISLRFRDFPPIIQSIMRLAFFATPIIWIERDLGDFGGLLLLINPFLWFLKIVRDPLIGYSIRQRMDHSYWNYHYDRAHFNSHACAHA